MQVKFENKARKEFLKFDREVQIQILRYIEKIKALENPRDMGKSLVGDLKNYWRYRVGNYRLKNSFLYTPKSSLFFFFAFVVTF